MVLFLYFSKPSRWIFLGSLGGDHRLVTKGDTNSDDEINRTYSWNGFEGIHSAQDSKNQTQK